MIKWSVNIIGCSFRREKCFLPLKLALESRSSKLSLHAVNGLQVSGRTTIFRDEFSVESTFCTVNGRMDLIN